MLSYGFANVSVDVHVCERALHWRASKGKRFREELCCPETAYTTSWTAAAHTSDSVRQRKAHDLQNNQRIRKDQGRAKSYANTFFFLYEA